MATNTVERYAKPKAMAGLPGWAKDIRNKSDFMPMKIKPVSYNYMAKVSPTYQAEVYAPATQTQTTIGNMYFKPTDDVAQGIKEEHNLWQDIKNLGGKIVHKGGSVLMGALDILSRPAYVMRNVYKQQLVDNYGGDGDVTGWEAIKGVVDAFTPVGIVKDLASGHMDDRLKAGWRGLSGQDKVFTKDIMEVIDPEWVKAHPKGAFWGGLAGDVFLDPVTFATMGMNPGSIVRGTGAGAKLLVGDKASASRLWGETLFTQSGRAAGAKTVKIDAINKEYGRLNRVQRRAQKKINKIDAGKNLRLSRLDKQALELRRDEAVAKITNKTLDQLKGAQLAALIIKKGAPTLGLNTFSRFNTGAGSATAIAGTKALTSLANDFHLKIATDLEKEDSWNILHLANRNQDFHYEHGGVKYTVNLKNKNLKDFIYRIAQEAAPIAKVAPGDPGIAAGRKIHIGATEARGQDFLTAFSKHMEDSFNVGFGDKTAKEFDDLRGIQKGVADATNPTDDELAKLGVLKLSQEDLTAEGMNFDELKKRALAEWKKANPGKNKEDWRQEKPYILLESADGKHRKVSLAAISRHSANNAAQRLKRVGDRKTIGKRTKQQAATDKLTGVSDESAAFRQNLVDTFNRLKAAKEATTAAEAEKADALTQAKGIVEEVKKTHGEMTAGEKNLTTDESKALFSEMKSVILGQDGLTDAERTKYLQVLGQTDIPLEQRIAAIVKDKNLSNEEVSEILEDVFKVYIDDDGIIHVSRGGNVNHIPEIIREVIMDRFHHRVSPEMRKASGIDLKYATDDTSGPVKFNQVAQDLDDIDAPKYLRDTNGEVGMMILDGYRAALSYAHQVGLWESNPEELFAVIFKSMEELTNELSADVKNQVYNLMYNATGMRLPQDFVPKVNKVQNLIGKKSFKFTSNVIDKKTGKPKEINQEIPWKNLTILIQDAVKDVFGFMDVPKHGIAQGGSDMTVLRKNIDALANDVDIPFHEPTKDVAAKTVKIKDLVAKAEKLSEKVGEVLLNGNVAAVNRYSFLDFMLYGDEILKAQTTTVHVGGKAGQKINRVASGRLSALDSFSFVDRETEVGLEAIEALKGLATSYDAEEATIAQRELARMFRGHGGLEHIDSLTMPASNSLADLDLTPHFSTLGIHARLKERTTRAGFEAKFSADILESMWDTESLIHNWNKAVQTGILNATFVEGRSVENAAEVFGKKIEEFFAPYENLKKYLYPVQRAVQTKEDIAAGLKPTQTEVSSRTLKGLGKKVQEDWGPNPIELARNKPRLDQPSRPKIDLGEGIDPETASTVLPRKGQIKAYVDKLIKEGKIDPRTIPEGHAGDVVRTSYVLQEHFGFTKTELDIMRKGLGNLDELDYAVVRAEDAKGNESVRGVAVFASGDKGQKARFFPTEVKGKFGQSHALDSEIDLGDAVKKAVIPDPAVRERYGPQLLPKEYAPKPVLEKNVRLRKPEQRVIQEGVAGTKVPEAQSAAMAEAIGPIQKMMDFKAANDKVKATADRLRAAEQAIKDAKGKEPVAEAELKAARVAYLEALKNAKGKGANLKPDPEVPVVPTGDASDFANIHSYTEFTEEEKRAIIKFIGLTYEEANPQKVARQLHVLTYVEADDVIMTQQKLISDFSDLNIKYGTRMKFLGIPYMPIGNPLNSTRTAAGVTAYEMEMSKGLSFFRDLTNPITGSSFSQQIARSTTRQSRYLEGGLEEIRMSVVNYANITRMRVLKDLDEWYFGMRKGVYDKVPALNGMKTKAKQRYIQREIFKPTPKGAPDALDQFTTTTGENYARIIADNLGDSASEVFPHTMDGNVRKRQIELFNKYVIDSPFKNKGFRLKDTDIETIVRHMNVNPKFVEMTPYSREWLQEVGQLQISRLNYEQLSTMNLGEFHYSMQDAKLKQIAGELLHKNVFELLAFKMDASKAKFRNEQVQPNMVDVNGKLMRGKVVRIKDIPIQQIKKENVPGQFINKSVDDLDYYIDETLLPDIATLFDYMEDIHKLNSIVDTRMLDKILNYFKASVTIYKFPSYFVRNLIGDVFMSAMDGVISIRKYNDASDLMKDYSKTLKELDYKNFKGMFDEDFIKREMAAAQHDVPNKIAGPLRKTPWHLNLQLDDGDTEINGSQVMDAFYAAGLGQNRVSGDVNQSLKAARLSGMGRLGGKVHDGLRQVNEIREDWARLAHFLHAIEAEAPLGGAIDDVFRRAAFRVKKFHFDYNDISLVDRKYLGRILPFYKWIKNIVPFTIAAMVTKPWALKAEQGISAATAQTVKFLSDDDDDPRTDYVVPSWITEDSAVQIGSFTEETGYQFGQWATMYLPLSQTLRDTLNPTFSPIFDPATAGKDKFEKAGAGLLQTSAGMLNPILKSYMQGSTGMVNWPTGPAPEGKTSWMDALLTIIPGYATANELQRSTTDLFAPGTTTGKSKPAAVLEALGAMNVSNNTENAQLGELNQREDFYRVQLDAKKAELMNRVQKTYPNTTAEERKLIVDEFLKVTRENDPERL